MKWYFDEMHRIGLELLDCGVLVEIGHHMDILHVTIYGEFDTKVHKFNNQQDCLFFLYGLLAMVEV